MFGFPFAARPTRRRGFRLVGVALAIWASLGAVGHGGSAASLRARALCGPIALSPRSEAEARLFLDALDGRFGEHTLGEAAIVASRPTDPDACEEALSRLVALRSAAFTALGGEGKTPPAAEKSARRLLTWIHREGSLVDYDAAASDVVRTLCEGRFNCVTASVLYQELARELGIEAAAAQTPGHVWTVARFGDAWTHVQTTSPRGWDRLLAPGHVVASGSAANDLTLEWITDVELVAKIYYNRAILLAQAKDYSAAVEDARAGLTLSPGDPTAAANLAAIVNNWSLLAQAEGDYLLASALVLQGLAWFPEDETLQANDIFIHHSWACELARQGRYAGARQKLEAAVTRYPHEAALNEGLRWLERPCNFGTE